MLIAVNLVGIWTEFCLTRMSGWRWLKVWNKQELFKQFFQIFQQVEKAFAPAAWGNQYHLFALSLGLRRPIYTFSSFLKNPQAIEPAECWAVGHQANPQALRDAFLAKENGTGVASQHLAREDDSSSRPLVILLAHSHFSALLPRPGCSIFEIPVPYSFVIPPLRWKTNTQPETLIHNPNPFFFSFSTKLLCHHANLRANVGSLSLSSCLALIFSLYQFLSFLPSELITSVTYIFLEQNVSLCFTLNIEASAANNHC